MKKYGLRVLVGLIAFAIGVSAVIALMFSERNLTCKRGDLENVEILQSKIQTSPNGKVEIRFIGYGNIENRPTLKLEISNHTSDSVKYWADKKNNPSIYVKFNGKLVNKIPGMICYFTSEFTLRKNESMVTEIFADLLTFKFLKEKGDFEFGFDNSFESGVWSEPINISEKMKKEIIKNAPDFFYPNKEEKPQMISPKQLAAFENF